MLPDGPCSHREKSPERGSADRTRKRHWTGVSCIGPPDDPVQAPERKVAADPEAEARRVRTRALVRHSRAVDAIFEAQEMGRRPDGSIPCPSVIRQHDGSAQAQDCRDDSRREDARKTGEAGRVGAGIGRRFTLVRARAPPLSSSTEKTKRVGGAGAETTRGSQDRFKGQPQERQHSAVESGTRDRLPPANDSRASRRVSINFAFMILWYRLVVEHVDARRAHVH
jgi:hypothetical protein